MTPTLCEAIWRYCLPCICLCSSGRSLIVAKSLNAAGSVSYYFKCLRVPPFRNLVNLKSLPGNQPHSALFVFTCTRSPTINILQLPLSLTLLWRTSHYYRACSSLVSWLVAIITLFSSCCKLQGHLCLLVHLHYRPDLWNVRLSCFVELHWNSKAHYKTYCVPHVYLLTYIVFDNRKQVYVLVTSVFILSWQLHACSF